jgi:hypothetical protein
VSGKEVFTPDPDLGPATNDAISPGQAAQQELPVAFGDDSAVQQHHNPGILPASNKPPKPLLQLESRMRQQVMHEAVQPLFGQPLQPRRRNRLRRHLER